MIAVFTDMDGCLLDHDTYDWKPALPALEALKARGAAVVLVTSKSRREVEHWQRLIGLTHPSIVENGGAAVLEDGTALALGKPRGEIVPLLEEAAAEAGAAIRGWTRMTAEEVAERTGLGVEHARMAMEREYSEPFVLLEAEREEALREAMGRRGLRLTRGGRFHHALAHEGKHAAVKALLEDLRARHGRVVSVGLGDAPNDAGFLAVVDRAVIIRSPNTPEVLKKVPWALVSEEEGPRGWSATVLSLLLEGALEIS
jgi:mannosyl-3-phosphoglycerate phosphatase